MGGFKEGRIASIWISSQQDERSQLGGLFYDLYKRTFKEVTSKLSEEEIAQNNSTREHVYSLVSLLRAGKEYSYEDLVKMGLIRLIDEEWLKQVASNEKNPLQKFARYFLEEKKTQEAENLPTSGAHEH